MVFPRNRIPDSEEGKIFAFQLYKVKHEVQFFGRGSIAGVDVNQQKKVCRFL